MLVLSLDFELFLSLFLPLFRLSLGRVAIVGIVARIR